MVAMIKNNLACVAKKFKQLHTVAHPMDARYGGGCLYTLIHWKTAASVLQRQASANGTGE